MSKVRTKIGIYEVDATNLSELIEALEPLIRNSVEAKESESPPRQELVDALVGSGSLLLAVQKKIGALVYQRDLIGIVDAELVILAEEIADAFLGDVSAEDDSPRIVTPA